MENKTTELEKLINERNQLKNNLVEEENKVKKQMLMLEAMGNDLRTNKEEDLSKNRRLKILEIE